MNQNNQRIAKNTLFLYIRLAVAMLASLYTTRVVLQALGVEDYGIYNVVCGFVAMFSFFGTSMSNCIQRFYNYELGRGGDAAVVKVYAISLAIQSLVALVLVIILLTIGTWYLNTEIVIPESRITAANWIFIFSIFSLVSVVLQTPYIAAVIAYERMNFFAIVSILDTFIKLGVAYIIQYVDTDRLILYGGMLTLVQILNLSLYICYCVRHFPHLRVIKLKYLDKSLFKKMFSFSGWNILSSFAFMLRGQGTNLLLNAFFGTIVNAANGIASQISYAVQSFSINVMVAFQPQLIQSYASGDYNRTEHLMFVMTKVSYVLFCILAIPLIVEMNYVLDTWLGGVVPDHAIQFSILTVMIMGMGLFHTSITQTIYATGKVMLFQISTSVIVGLILPISWLCLKFGANPESVYIITFVLYILNWLVCLMILHRAFKFDMKRYAVMIVECMILTALSLLCAWLVRIAMPESFVRLISVFLVTLLVLTGGIVIFSNKTDRKNIIELCKKKFTR